MRTTRVRCSSCDITHCVTRLWPFLASPEDDVASSEASVRQLLEPQQGSAVFGALASGLVGMVGLNRNRQHNAAHKVFLRGMFVLPEYRGQGIGARLLDRAIHHARGIEGVTSVHLSMSAT